jgi:hypothetical protein
MALDSESFNKDLYDLLKIRGYKPVALNARNQRVEASPKADVIEFTFKKDGEEYGKAWVTIDDASNVVLYYDEEQADSPDGATPGLEFDDSWTGFIKHLKSWAMRRQLDFELSDKDRLGDDMRHREYFKMKENIAEGYYPMGKSASYNDSVPSIKIILQHTKQIQEGEQRFRNIARIFLENTLGERILAPTTRPGIARVYARHLAEGGLPHDDRWQHIGSLVEDYTKMAGFVRATRNKQFNESAQSLINEGVNHYESLRETLSRMTGKRGYNAYFESYTPALMETEGDESNLNELFVQETLDPRIESVMPILSRLRKNIGEMKEVSELAEWADNITEAPGAETLKHNIKTDAKNLKAFDLEENEQLTEYSNLDSFMNKVARYEDPFMMIYRGLTGKYGEDVRIQLQNMYDDISIENRLHPDDDLEDIIDHMITRAENDSPMKEGKFGNVLAGAGLIAMLWGTNYMQAKNAYEHSPQLQKLEQFYQRAKKEGNEAKIKEIENRIQMQKDRLNLDRGEVMGDNGKPIDPQYESQINEIDDPDEYPKGRIEFTIDRKIAREKPGLNQDQRKALIRGWIQKNMENGISRDEAEKLTLKQVIEFGANILSSDPNDTAISRADKQAGNEPLTKGDMPRKEKRLPDTSSDDLFKILKLGVGLSEEEMEENFINMVPQAVAEEEVEESDGDPKSHQAQTTLKHLKKASYGDRADAATIKPGIAGYKDRIDILKRAEREGNLKDEDVAEDLDANQKRVGQLGPTEKVRNHNIGKLVGANESVEFDELAALKRLLGK